jgi:CDP-diglyceride synthetase
MKDFFKSILVLAAIVSAFFMGVQFGKTKEKAKIPNFQEDTEGHI